MMTPEENGSLANRLTDRARQGDEEALAQLFSMYRDKLRRMVQVRLDRRIQARADPSDVLQETYLDAVIRLRHLTENPSMPVFLWFRLLVRQRLIDLHREHLGYQIRRADREVSMNQSVSPYASSEVLAANLTGHLTSPSQKVGREELLAQVEEALERMSPVDREIITLRHFEELSNQEAAEILGIGKTAASNRYVRALKRLKELLSEIPGMNSS